MNFVSPVRVEVVHLLKAMSHILVSVNQSDEASRSEGIIVLSLPIVAGTVSLCGSNRTPPNCENEGLKLHYRMTNASVIVDAPVCCSVWRSENASPTSQTCLKPVGIDVVRHH